MDPPPPSSQQPSNPCSGLTRIGSAPSCQVNDLRDSNKSSSCGLQIIEINGSLLRRLRQESCSSDLLPHDLSNQNGCMVIPTTKDDEGGRRNNVGSEAHGDKNVGESNNNSTHSNDGNNMKQLEGLWNVTTEINVEEPYSGMTFDTVEDVQNYYQKYARSKGFSIVKFSGKKDNKGELRSQTFACHRSKRPSNKGTNTLRPRLSIRVCCPARLYSHRGPDGKWKVTSLVLLHNHKMTPSTSRLIQQHKEVSAHVRRSEMNDSTGIQLSNMEHCVVQKINHLPDSIKSSTSGLQRSCGFDETSRSLLQQRSSPPGSPSHHLSDKNGCTMISMTEDNEATSRNEGEGEVLENENVVELNDDNQHSTDGNKITEWERVLNVSTDINVEEPYPGMAFDTVEEAQSYYQEYARSKGFSIVKFSGKKDEKGELRSQTFACHRSRRPSNKGSNALRPRPSIRVCCPARLYCHRGPDGRWRISSMVRLHNHKMTASKSKFLPQHREVSTHVRMLEMNDLAGIRPNKTVQSTVNEVGGYNQMAFTTCDCRNCITNVRRLHFREGDAAALHGFFCQMQQRSKDFFYVIDADEDGRLKNVLWVDQRSKAAYEEFHDVVMFDTSYLLNKYNVLVAPFVGVNHHGESVLFGCALVSSEDMATFCWVFRNWLTYMNNIEPRGIITDQCAPIGNAVAKVFPKAIHRWGLRHIMMKLPEKMESYSEYNEIIMYFKHVVHDSFELEEFEMGWALMLEMFNLQHDAWLTSLYDERTKWVPVYIRKQFWAGMSHTQHDENKNAYFDGYVNSKSSLKQFIDQFQVALWNKIEKETQADYNSMVHAIPAVTKFSMEKQFQICYTNEIFRKLQGELINVMYCESQLTGVDGDWQEYLVREKRYADDSIVKTMVFKVRLQDRTKDITCNCQMFESCGILCCHVLRVLTSCGVERVPEKYVLRRWRKDIRRRYSKIKCPGSWEEPSVQVKRIEELEKMFYQAADVASENETNFRFLKNLLSHGIRKMENPSLDLTCEGVSLGSIENKGP